MMDARLDEYDMVEWFDVCRRIRPELTWEEYAPMWESFQDDKAQRQRSQALQ